MTDAIILQLITTIHLFCQPGTSNYNQCFKEIWSCGHNVTTPTVIVSETHNCISDYLKRHK